MSLFNDMMTWFIRRRMERIRYSMDKPIETQAKTFTYLMSMVANTEWGRQYGLTIDSTIAQFRERVPVQNYDTLKPYIDRLMKGEQFLLWPTHITWFAKSSGTTSDKSKFIPVSKESLEDCHYKAGRDTVAIYCENRPDTKIFKGKSLVMGGSNRSLPNNNEAQAGDVSAVMLQNLPFIAEYFRTPDLSIALMDEWEEKIERIAETTIKEHVTYMAGVPSWTMVLIRKVFEKTGAKHLHDVWPDLELFLHGGVSFGPYRDQYAQVITDPKMNYMETYNASEGFIALQNDLTENDLLLMLDLGIFFEFMPMEEAGKEYPNTVLLDEVEVGQQYALVISTNAGLWRYQIGDTVRFTSKYPFKIEVSGRVKHFINAFGEEVVVDNTDKALALACAQTQATVKEYTACPVFTGDGKGYHQWLIEFEQAPADMAQFAQLLDEALQELNSDYEAKRYKNMVLDQLQVEVLPTDGFYNWLKGKGKLGGQHKVPRLSNTDNYVKEILASLTAAAK